MSVRRNPLNGCLTWSGNAPRYEDAKTQEPLSNHWSSTENNGNNAWNVNFNTGNTGNNNKYNSNVVRAVAALGEDFKDFYLSVITAYEDCLVGKGGSSEVRAYSYNAAEDLYNIAYEMYSGTYNPSTSTCFVVTYPKPREVFAASVRDRVVHHWMNQRVEPIYEKRYRSMGNVTHACRKGMGTKTAVQSAYDGIKAVSENYRREAWIMKGDFKAFFPSIPKSKLADRVLREIRRHYRGRWKDILLRIMEVTIMHCPEEDCVLNSDPDMWELVDESKSLFRNGRDYGQAIGNLPTQHNAGLYLSYFDLYALWLLRSHNAAYVRLVDDFVMAAQSKELLVDVMAKLELFAKDTLGLTIHKSKRYLQPASHGVKFVGAVLKNGRIYLSNRTVARMTEKVEGFNKTLTHSKNILTADLQRILSVMNSYLGLCKGKRTYNIRKAAILSFVPEFWRYFYVEGHYEVVKLKSEYRMVA